MKKTLFALAALVFTTMLAGCEKEDKNSISKSDVNKGIVMIEGRNGKEFAAVDLGLSSGILWATCNIGASSPEETGNYYAWGEIEPKSYYDAYSYKWLDEKYAATYTKYINDKKDNPYYNDSTKKNVLYPEDDVAYMVMGENWFMPSQEDFEELIFRCERRYCKLNGVWGFLFTSKVKGYTDNSIFLPFAGRREDNKIKFDEDYGFYWSRNLYTKPESDCAYNLWLQADPDIADAKKFSNRTMGLSVRAVTLK